LIQFTLTPWQKLCKSFLINKSKVDQRTGGSLIQFLGLDPRCPIQFANITFKEESTRSIDGVTLHSYRYAWAERAKSCGYPERFAQEALGHNSKAVHRAYAKRAQMKIPSLEDYEQRAI
jgi:integrase